MNFELTNTSPIAWDILELTRPRVICFVCGEADSTWSGTIRGVVRGEVKGADVCLCPRCTRLSPEEILERFLKRTEGMRLPPIEKEGCVGLSVCGGGCEACPANRAE